MYDVHAPPLMGCGHAANSTFRGEPACVICAGIHVGATVVVDDKPDLTGRVATCTYCDNECPSTDPGAFFAYRPDREKDSWYCGCRGWN